jgi:hypothetical protein
VRKDNTNKFIKHHTSIKPIIFVFDDCEYEQLFPAPGISFTRGAYFLPQQACGAPNGRSGLKL